MHGSLLPKNPHFADYLIGLALRRKYERNNWATPGTSTNERTNVSTSSEDTDRNSEPLALLTPLDDALEWEAHTSLLENLGLHDAAIAAWHAHNVEKAS
jgi:hypothetical protein